MTTDRNLTLPELIEARGVPERDCRDCARFEPDDGGLQCGWCQAHEMWVKLYQRPALWHSQCQFLQIRRERPLPEQTARAAG